MVEIGIQELWDWIKTLVLIAIPMLCMAASIRYYVDRRAEKIYWAMRAKEDAEAEKDIPRYGIIINGMVQVNKAALKITAHSPPVIAIPEEVYDKLNYLSPRYLHDVIRQVKSFEASAVKTMKDDTLRGLTIGSALFNYSIPESFVLIDDRTCQMASRFVANDLRRMSVVNWLVQEEGHFKTLFNVYSEYEQINSQQFNRDTLLDFYHKHYPLISQQLIKHTQGDHFPSIIAFTASILRHLQRPTTDGITHHHIYCSVGIMVSILELKVPMGWVWPTECTTEVTEILLGAEPKRPQLKLVINNQ